MSLRLFARRWFSPHNFDRVSARSVFAGSTLGAAVGVVDGIRERELVCSLVVHTLLGTLAGFCAIPVVYAAPILVPVAAVTCVVESATK